MVKRTPVLANKLPWACEQFGPSSSKAVDDLSPESQAVAREISKTKPPNVDDRVLSGCSLILRKISWFALSLG